MEPEECLSALATSMPDRSAQGLAETLLRLIRNGQLQAGDRLPTVRRVAAYLRMSPSSVAAGWRILLDAHAIETRRRGGTFVLGSPTPVSLPRYERLLTNLRGRADLGRLSSDPSLWPSPARAFAWSVQETMAEDHLPTPITPALLKAALPIWPYRPPALMATDGGPEGLAIALRALVMPGERVLVSDPTESVLLDRLELMRCVVVPIPHDDDGPRVDVLARELEKDPPVFIHSSGPQSPLGRVTSQARMNEIAAVIEPHQTTVIEISLYPAFMTSATPTVGMVLPDRVVHVCWYGRSHGLDILVGLVAADPEVLRKMWVIRGYDGAQWTSRYLQNALAFMLTDEVSIDAVDHARRTYDQRRDALVARLAKAGIVCKSNAGTSAWVPVPDEESAWQFLAQCGYAVQRGSDLHVTGKGDPHLRISIGNYREDVEELADRLIQATVIADPFSGSPD